jgi:hypothetical protein
MMNRMFGGSAASAGLEAIAPASDPAVAARTFLREIFVVGS